MIRSPEVAWRDSFNISKIELNVLMIIFHVKAMDAIENISVIG
jgi:hypothetical protein